MSSPYESWQPPVAQPGAGPFPPRPTPSALAVVSLIMGAISPFLICLCYVSLATSLAAIVTGHVARSSIRRSGGALTGAGVALGGLILGYITFAVTAAVLVGGLYLFRIKPEPQMAETQAVSAPTAASALQDVELKILSDDEGVALGNTAEARELAEEFADAMERHDQDFFTDTDATIKLSGGHYVTWCELHSDRCAFVVHVPEYRRFDAKAKQLLSKLAWQTAQDVAGERLPPGAGLAVGLKGVVLYGAVMVGSVRDPAAAGQDPGPDSTGTAKQALVPFFERPTEVTPESDAAPPSIELEAPDEIPLEAPAAPESSAGSGGETSARNEGAVIE